MQLIYVFVVIHKKIQKCKLPSHSHMCSYQRRMKIHSDTSCKFIYSKCWEKQTTFSCLYLNSYAFLRNCEIYFSFLISVLFLTIEHRYAKYIAQQELAYRFYASSHIFHIFFPVLQITFKSV